MTQRSGKSLHAAIRVAAALKAGQRVMLASKGSIEEIVGVPGLDDGRQLPNLTVALPDKPR